MEQSYHILQDQLKSYCADGPYPMHMPGHKRNLSPGPGLPYDFDVTEVEGTDDLHHADGDSEGGHGAHGESFMEAGERGI